jgi:hypothetical protein
VASGGDWNVPAPNLILPSGAPPGTPRLDIGPDSIPTILTTFYAPNTPIAAMLGEANATTYHYTLWLFIQSTGEMVLVNGFVSGGQVYETYAEYFDPSSGIPRTINFGDFFGGRLNGISWAIQGATLATNSQGLGSGGSTHYSDFAIGGGVDFTIGGRSQGRGLWARTGSTANIAVVGATRILATPLTTYYDTRAYQAVLHAIWNGSVAGITALVSLLNGVGTGISGATRTPTLALAALQFEIDLIFPFKNTSGADVSTGMQIGVTPSAGTVNLNGTVLFPTTFEIFDVGTAPDFPDYPSL